MPKVPRIGVATPTSSLEALVDADLGTLATALYVRTDDLLKARPQRAPWRPAVGISPQISDAELVTLAVLQPQGLIADEPQALQVTLQWP
jgi:hypothetical protein